MLDAIKKGGRDPPPHTNKAKHGPYGRDGIEYEIEYISQVIGWGYRAAY